jgi:class 3 adenylate cyclase/tetratricopeptide (TPR) repeat protein
VPVTDLVTIVITDWVDSTGTRTRLGEERADELQRVHDELLRETVARHDGIVVKGSGDGVLATFHSASNALTAAVAIQQRFDGYSSSPAAIASVEVRIGLSVGDVVHQDGDIFGTPVVEAARLESAAEPGQILCSDMVRMLARGRGDHRFEVLGLLELKGLAEPLAACAVHWERAATAGASSFPVPPELSVSGGMRFVGRDEELQAAVTLATGVTRPHGLWLLGEPGIGKTRLATEVALRAHAGGALVLFGRCDEDVGAPFQPVIQALRWYIGHVEDDQLAAALGIDPEALARLVPELRLRLPRPGTGAAPTTEAEQYRLFEAIRSWLSATAATRSVVFLVDDVQWADRPTLTLLGHVLRSADAARLTVIGTARDTELDVNEALTELIDDLTSLGRGQRLALRGLSSDEVMVLVASAALAGDDTALANRIADETAGNPLFVGALLAGFAGSGDDGDQRGELPSDLRAAVRRRVRRLPRPAQDFLQVAAVEGIEFSLRVAADAAGLGEDESLTRVEQAVRAGLVHELAVDRFRFTHALVRDSLAGDLSASRQARVHAAIAASLEARHGSAIDEHLRAVAHHLSSAGGSESLDRAFDYAVRSARRSLEMLAFDAAVEDYRMALGLLDRLTTRTTGDRLELLIAKGEAEVLAAAHGSAVETLQAAIEAARAEQDWQAFARTALAFEDATWRPGSLGHQAVGLLREAAEHAGALAPRDAIAVQASLGRALHYAGETEAANEIGEAALGAARRLGDVKLLTHALSASVQIRVPMRAEDFGVIVDRAQEVWELRDETDDLTAAESLSVYAVVACLCRGARDDAMFWLRRVQQTVDITGWRFERYVLNSLLQTTAFLDGDLARAETGAEQNLEFSQQLGEDVSGVHGVQMFLIRREQDRLDELVPVVRMLLQVNPATAMWRPGLVLLLATVGMAEEAGGQLRDLVATGFRGLPRDNLFPAAVAFLAESAFLLDARDAARELERSLRPWAGTGISVGHFVGHLGAADRYLGLLARLDGRLDVAFDRLNGALDFNRRLGAVIWEAHTLADLADVERTRGERDRARVRLAEGRLLAARYALPAVERRLRALAPFLV